jgi:hypothetical protein
MSDRPSPGPGGFDLRDPTWYDVGLAHNLAHRLRAERRILWAPFEVPIVR